MENSKNSQSHKHFVIYKPYGCLSQFVNNQNRRTNKKLLGDLYDFPEGTMAIGRLDESSEGLLLLTTDGKMSEFIRGNKVEKEYYVQVDGLISDEEIEKIRKGVEIGRTKTLASKEQSELYNKSSKYVTKPCKAFLLKPAPKFPERGKKIRDDRHGPTSWISIILKEGKFRQVRKMTSAVGHPTLRLIRVRVGGIKLESMGVGEVKDLTDFIQ